MVPLFETKSTYVSFENNPKFTNFINFFEKFDFAIFYPILPIKTTIVIKTFGEKERKNIN